MTKQESQAKRQEALLELQRLYIEKYENGEIDKETYIRLVKQTQDQIKEIYDCE